MANPDELLCQTHGRSILLALRQKLGLAAAYSAFRFAAESEDRAERLQSAAWDIFGRAIVVALSLPGAKFAGAVGDRSEDTLASDDPGVGISEFGDGLRGLYAKAPELQPIAARIADSLELLADAGRVGGNLSAAAVATIADRLSAEFGAFLAGVDRLLSPHAALRPRLDS